MWTRKVVFGQRKLKDVYVIKLPQMMNKKSKLKSMQYKKYLLKYHLW